jgi:hypothetical protein
MLLEETQHVFPDMRRVVMRDDGLAGALGQRDLARLREGMRGRYEHHELVLAEHNRVKTRFRGLKRQHPEIQAALGDFGADLSGRYAPHVHMDERMGLAEALDEGKGGVHRGFVGADQYPASAEVTQVLDGGLGLLREAEQSLGIVPESVASLVARSNSRSPTLSSRRLTDWLTAGWVRCSFIAAREKLRSAATFRKTRSSVSSIGFV